MKSVKRTGLREWILRSVFFRKRLRSLHDKNVLYARDISCHEIERFQVDTFNRVWAKCLAEVPFYRAWQIEWQLPDEIASTTDLVGFPPLYKQTVTARSAEIFQQGAIKSAYTTGGSTGVPTRYPRGAYDVIAGYANTYATRQWSGIKPFESCVLLWGHSHLFGAGLRRPWLRMRRSLLDRALNITRLDAYDLTDRALRGHYDKLVERDPTHLIGYTSAIFQLAQFILREDLTFKGDRRLKVVVVTAETVTSSDIAVIEKAFQVAVAIEYGSAETGVIAASCGKSWPLQVLWDSNICSVNDSGEIRVTTLAPRLFPLINYDIGDVAKFSSTGRSSVLSIPVITGRRQDNVRVRTIDGRPVTLSAILPVHILKSYPGILAVQYFQADDVLDIYFTARWRIPTEQIAAFFTAELRRDYAAFDSGSVRLCQVPSMSNSRSGKHLLFAERRSTEVVDL